MTDSCWGQEGDQFQATNMPPRQFRAAEHPEVLPELRSDNQHMAKKHIRQASAAVSFIQDARAGHANEVAYIFEHLAKTYMWLTPDVSSFAHEAGLQFIEYELCCG